MSDKIVSYTYLTKANAKYIEKLNKMTGQPKTFCINAILDAMRNDEELHIPKFEPKFVRKAREYQSRCK